MKCTLSLQVGNILKSKAVRLKKKILKCFYQKARYPCKALPGFNFYIKSNRWQQQKHTRFCLDITRCFGLQVGITRKLNMVAREVQGNFRWEQLLGEVHATNQRGTAVTFNKGKCAHKRTVCLVV